MTFLAVKTVSHFGHQRATLRTFGTGSGSHSRARTVPSQSGDMRQRDAEADTAPPTRPDTRKAVSSILRFQERIFLTTFRCH
jgi:hypothetical protein